MTSKEKPKGRDFLSEFKHGQKCWTPHCAEFSNGNLREAGFNIYGDAWNLQNADLVHSGYDGVDKKGLEYDSTRVSNRNIEASRNFRDNFDSRAKLDTLQNYAVTMKHDGSNYQKRAFNEGENNTSTHTGYMTWKNSAKGKPGTWEVTHNTGIINKENFYDLQNPSRKNAVTAVYALNEKSGMDKLKGILRKMINFEQGGTIDFMMPRINEYNKNFNNER